MRYYREKHIVPAGIKYRPPVKELFRNPVRVDDYNRLSE